MRILQTKFVHLKHNNTTYRCTIQNEYDSKVGKKYFFSLQIVL